MYVPRRYPEPMKTCLITGASGGVAGALAERLRAQGWQLALAGREAARIPSHDGDCVIAADVSSEAGAVLALAQAEQAFSKPPDAVVHAAGSIVVAPVTRTSERQYRDCMAANADSAFFVAKAYLASIQAHKRPGNLLLFSSVAARIGVANHVAVAMAKASVEALVRSLAADHSATGLRVNAIAPGLLRAPATRRFLSSEAAERQIAAQYPAGRIGELDDAVAAASFLLSDEAGWINGQVLGLDGGFTAVRPAVRGV